MPRTRKYTIARCLDPWMRKRPRWPSQTRTKREKDKEKREKREQS
jgi:hypothetical protein